MEQNVLQCRIINEEYIVYYCFDSISSREEISHFISLIILCNSSKERGGESPTNEVTSTYCGVFLDLVCIGYFLVYSCWIMCVLVVSVFVILTQMVYASFFNFGGEKCLSRSSAIKWSCGEKAILLILIFFITNIITCNILHQRKI